MRPNQGTTKICIVFLLIEILLTLRRIACEQLTPPYQDTNILPKILKIFNNEISLCYFFSAIGNNSLALIRQEFPFSIIPFLPA